MNQLTFSDVEYSNRRKKTKREEFLDHVQDGTDFFTSAGIPIRFKDICVSVQEGYSNYDSRKIPAMPEKTMQIGRGQRVKNL